MLIFQTNQNETYTLKAPLLNGETIKIDVVNAKVIELGDSGSSVTLNVYAINTLGESIVMSQSYTLPDINVNPSSSNG